MFVSLVIWWPYRMKLQPLQRWALRKRWMWASWCKGCHVPSNSKIWFISCSLTIAYLMFLFGQKITPQYCIDSLNFTELDDTTLPFGYVWKMICFVQFYDIHHTCIFLRAIISAWTEKSAFSGFVRNFRLRAVFLFLGENSYMFSFGCEQ